VIDLHSHILPGVDDGVATTEQSLELARAAVADGVEAIAATPHVRDDYPTTAETMERGVASLRTSLASSGIELTLLPGGELALDRLDAYDAKELRRYGLGGNESYLLVETPYRAWPLDLGDRIFRLAVAGITAVLAHPERNDAVQEDPGRLEPLVRAGALVQLTAASVDGRFGRRAAGTAQVLLERGLAHLVASDAHAPSIRAVGMSAAAEALGGGALARWLTVDVPRAIVDGTTVPARPADQRRRAWWSRTSK
jgi:protein-tyrosine phosphatase